MKWKLKRLLSDNIIRKSRSFPTSFTNSDILLLYNIIITSPIPTISTDTKIKNYDQNFCGNNFSTESKIFGLRSVSFWSFEDNYKHKEIFKELKIYYYHEYINKKFELTMYCRIIE